MVEYLISQTETLCADSTNYLDGLVMTRGKPSMYLFDGGYCSFDAAGRAVFHYYDRDHLGNVRAVVGDDGAVEQVMNYYPFGAPYCDETALIRRAILRRDRAQRRPAAIQVQRQGA